MYSSHWQKRKVLYGNPFPLCFSVEILAVKNMEGELEVGISLVERADGLFTFNP